MARHEVLLQKSVVAGSLLWKWHYRGPLQKKLHFTHTTCICNNDLYSLEICRNYLPHYLWKFDLDTRTWNKIIDANGPIHNWNKCIMLSHHKKLILFSYAREIGTDYYRDYTLDEKTSYRLNIYCTESNKWTNITGSIALTDVRSASMHGSRMILFGIRRLPRDNDTHTRQCDTTVCFNIDSKCWEEPSISGNYPVAMLNTSQIELGEKYLLLFGTEDTTIPSTNPVNYIWLLKMEGTNWTWKKVTVHNTEYGLTDFLWICKVFKVGNYVLFFNPRIEFSSTYTMAEEEFLPRKLKTSNGMSPFIILDIKNVLDDCSASWIPFNQNTCFPFKKDFFLPSNSSLSFFMAGKGELMSVTGYEVISYSY